MGTGAGIRESVSAKLDADAVECARSRCLDSEGTSLPGRTRMPTIGYGPLLLFVFSLSVRFTPPPSVPLFGAPPCGVFGLDRVPSVGDEADAEPGD
jgi:hypothetical protein